MLLSVCENQDLKNKISLDENSNVSHWLEGDADEILYKKLDDGKSIGDLMTQNAVFLRDDFELRITLPFPMHK